MPITRDHVVLRIHTHRRMRERRISMDDVLAVINANDVIENYPTDTPYPSVLGLATVNGRPLHVVWVFGPAQMFTVVTAYEPDPARWDATLRIRQRRES